MNLKHIFWPVGRDFDREYRVLAVGAYSFAALSAATIIQILTASPVDPLVQPFIARVAFTIMPLLGAGLALDFYCIGNPRMGALAGLLGIIIGALLAISAQAFADVIGVYSAQSAKYLDFGLWAGLGIIIFAFVLSLVLGPRETNEANPPNDVQ